MAKRLEVFVLAIGDPVKIIDSAYDKIHIGKLLEVKLDKVINEIVISDKMAD